jgi:hypothetical protein
MRWQPGNFFHTSSGLAQRESVSEHQNVIRSALKFAVQVHKRSGVLPNECDWL